MIRAYAGIGSRNITESERENIVKISKILSKKYIVYSGNANGSDIAFQTGSDGLCVVYLPWKGFNQDNYNHQDAHFIVPEETKESVESVYEFHPNANNLTKGVFSMMRRNYHQVMGYGPYPRVEFVICCSDPNGKGGVCGGTGHAVRIAKSVNIPVINIREPHWLEKIKNIS